jgi:hypothetical protein
MANADSCRKNIVNGYRRCKKQSYETNTILGARSRHIVPSCHKVCDGNANVDGEAQQVRETCEGWDRRISARQTDELSQFTR